MLNKELSWLSLRASKKFQGLTELAKWYIHNWVVEELTFSNFPGKQIWKDSSQKLGWFQEQTSELCFLYASQHQKSPLFLILVILKVINFLVVSPKMSMILIFSFLQIYGLQFFLVRDVIESAMMSKKLYNINNSMDAANTNRIIQHLRKIQFICEFFILSKVSQDHDSVPELLMIIEAFKFYFKSVAISESKGIYIESTEPTPQPVQQIDDLNEEKSTVDDEIDRQKKLLDLIRVKPFQSFNYYPSMFEKMATGKKMQLVTAARLPIQLKKTPLQFRHIIGEFLTVLRPLISIICIRLFGIDSYKSYLASLMMDIIIIVIFQRGLKVTSEDQKKEMSRRKNEMIMRYLFRKPFFLLLKRLLIEPLLAKIIKPERMVSKLILSIIEMQSSISLTL